MKTAICWITAAVITLCVALTPFAIDYARFIAWNDAMDAKYAAAAAERKVQMTELCLSMLKGPDPQHLKAGYVGMLVEHDQCDKNVFRIAYLGDLNVPGR